MNDRGFQLLELILVCFLIVSSVTGAALFVKGISDRQRLENGAQDFLALIAAARTLSIGKNVAVEVRVDRQQQTYSLSVSGTEPVLWRRLPSGLFFKSIPRRPVVFYSRGTAAPGGSYVVGGTAGEVKIVVAVSGRVRWQRL